MRHNVEAKFCRSNVRRPWFEVLPTDSWPEVIKIRNPPWFILPNRSRVLSFNHLIILNRIVPTFILSKGCLEGNDWVPLRPHPFPFKVSFLNSVHPLLQNVPNSLRPIPMLLRRYTVYPRIKVRGFYLIS